MGVARRYRGSFPCSASGAREARREYVKFAAQRLSGRDLSDFETAIGEALANAVEHSHASTLTVTGFDDGERLVAEIRDDGRGFLPRLDIEPVRGALRGYGLYIMHQLLDEVEFSDDGRSLRLVKRLP
ncbi:MAG: ATP-binding protein [Candidatus Eremiobacteraeota bacterium]|nr:ATP-binding protein [Candidatus Eremiobacteraeota bacterium]